MCPIKKKKIFRHIWKIFYLIPNVPKIIYIFLKRFKWFSYFNIHFQIHPSLNMHELLEPIIGIKFRKRERGVFICTYIKRQKFPAIIYLEQWKKLAYFRFTLNDLITRHFSRWSFCMHRFRSVWINFKDWCTRSLRYANRELRRHYSVINIKI